jgi:hypothetical protein
MLYYFCPEDVGSIFLRNVGTRYQTKRCHLLDKHKIHAFVLCLLLFYKFLYFPVGELLVCSLW